MHPSPEQLIAYRAGSLSTDEEDALRAHLIYCDGCAELLLDLASLEISGPESVAIPPSDMESAWQAHRQLQLPPLQKMRKVFRFSGWAVAACLTVLSIYQFSHLQASRRNDVEAYERDLPLLFADQADTRDPNALPPFDIVDGEASLLVLPVLPKGDGTQFRVELYFEERLLLTRESVSVHRDHLFLVLPPNRLPAGDIRVVVYESDPKSMQSPEEFFFEVRYRERP